jgi:hypothetical protein
MAAYDGQGSAGNEATCVDAGRVITLATTRMTARETTIVPQATVTTTMTTDA